MSKRFHLLERLSSFRFALRGLRILLAVEHNARIHFGATLAVIFAGILFHLAIEEWRWLILAIALVWAAEAFNTAVERLGDAITFERNANIGTAKDVAAGAVLVCSLASAAIGATVFAPHLMARLAA